MRPICQRKVMTSFSQQCWAVKGELGPSQHHILHMPFTMQGSRTQCILTKRTPLPNALLIFLSAILMLKFSYRSFFSYRAFSLLIQSNGVTGLDTMRKKNNSSVINSIRKISLLRLHSKHDLISACSPLITVQALFSLLHTHKKNTEKKKQSRRNHSTTSPWTTCSYMETVVIVAPCSGRHLKLYLKISHLSHESNQQFCFSFGFSEAILNSMIKCELRNKDLALLYE